jgi:cytoskeletal protein CcmA (bactofilin family)
MWNREPVPSAPQPTPATPKPVLLPETKPGTAAPCSIIGESVRIKGEITANEELHVHGEVEGRIDLAQRLMVGPSGKVNAGIKAREVVIGGNVKGGIEAVERIIIKKGAHLVGDVKTAGIVIEDGAYFKGSIDIVRPVPAQAAPKLEQKGATA